MDYSVFIDETGTFLPNHPNSLIGGWVVRGSFDDKGFQAALGAILKHEIENGSLVAYRDEPWLKYSEHERPKLYLHYSELMGHSRKPEFPVVPPTLAHLIAEPLLKKIRDTSCLIFTTSGSMSYYTGMQDHYYYLLRCTVCALLRETFFQPGDTLSLTVASRSKVFHENIERNSELKGLVQKNLESDLRKEFLPRANNLGLSLNLRFIQAHQVIGLQCADFILGYITYGYKNPTLKASVGDFSFSKYNSKDFADILARGDEWGRFVAACQDKGPREDIALLPQLLWSAQSQPWNTVLKDGIHKDDLELLEDEALNALEDAHRDRRYLDRDRVVILLDRLLQLLAFNPNDPMCSWSMLERLHRMKYEMLIHRAGEARELMQQHFIWVDNNKARIFPEACTALQQRIRSRLVGAQSLFNTLEFHQCGQWLKKDLEDYRTVVQIVYGKELPDRDEILAPLLGTLGQADIFMGALESDPELRKEWWASGRGYLETDRKLLNMATPSWHQVTNYLVTLAWMEGDIDRCKSLLAEQGGSANSAIPLDFVRDGSRLCPDPWSGDSQVFIYLNELRLAALIHNQGGTIRGVEHFVHQLEQLQHRPWRYPLNIVCKWLTHHVMHKLGREALPQSFHATALLQLDNTKEPLFKLINLPLYWHYADGKKLKEVLGILATQKGDGWEQWRKRQRPILHKIEQGSKELEPWEVMILPPYYYG